jgi:hypothetical protein
MNAETKKERAEVLNTLKEMWQRADSPLHRIYPSWEELEKNVQIDGKIIFKLENVESPEEVTKSQMMRESGTGGLPWENFKDIVYRFDPYEITVRLSPDNKFICITEVKVKKDFMSYKEKISTKGFHEVESFYRE